MGPLVIAVQRKQLTPTVVGAGGFFRGNGSRKMSFVRCYHNSTLNSLNASSVINLQFQFARKTFSNYIRLTKTGVLEHSMSHDYATVTSRSQSGSEINAAINFMEVWKYELEARHCDIRPACRLPPAIILKYQILTWTTNL